MTTTHEQERQADAAAGDVLSRVPSVPSELEASYRGAIKLGWLLGYEAGWSAGVTYAAQSMQKVMDATR